MLRLPACTMGTAGEDLPRRLPPPLCSAAAMPGRFSSACGAAGGHLACKAAATVSNPGTLRARAGGAIRLQGFFVGRVFCLPPAPPQHGCLPSPCSKRGGRLLSPFIPWPQISGGGWAAGRHRTNTCVPDLSSCACDTPSICGASHVLLPVAFPGAGWERSRGQWEGGREPQQNFQTTLCLLIDFLPSPPRMGQAHS